MKRFTEYLNEDFDPAIFNADGGVSINDPTVMDAINSNLEMATSCAYRTPYNALEEVRKMLAYYKIFLPKGVFLDQNHGNDVFEVSQFGEKMGMNNDGEVVTASDSPLFVYFEWSLNEKGMFDIFASLVNQDELDEILADYEAEIADDETDLQEQHSVGKLSKMLYNLVNQIKAAKQSDDVDSLINHEKQGKTFTQVNEKVMPDLNKKMGSKKVTLVNQMRKEETVNEIADTKRGKEAVRQAVHRADATVVDAAINPPRSKKARREAKNAMKTVDRGIAIHKKKGGVLDNYLKRSYGIKEETQLNELHRKSKEAMKKIKARLEKKHDDEWEKTTEKRKEKKSVGPADTRGEDKKRNDLAKRWLRADKADKLATEESELMTTKKEKEMYVHTHKTSGKEKHMTTSKPTSDEWTVKKLKKR